MKQIITGIVYRRKVIKDLIDPNIKLLDSRPPFYCNYDLNKKNWVNGKMDNTQGDQIIFQIIDNKQFVVDNKWSIISYHNQKNNVILVRDIPGICPLYYYHDNDIFIFSNALSEIIKVLPHSLRINQKVVSEMLFFNKMEHSNETLIYGLKEVKQGCFFTCDLHNWVFRSKKYAVISNEENRHIEYRKLVQRNRQAIESFISEKTKYSMDASHALLLSGGIDSSCLAHVLHELLPPNQLTFYTMTYACKSIDESYYAKEVADQYPHVSWKKVFASSKEFINEIEDIHRVIEWPTLSSGTFNQFILMQKCAEDGQKYIWDGLGADALYGGHDHYKHQLTLQYFRSLKLLAAAEVIGWKGQNFKETMYTIKSIVKNRIVSSKILNKLFLKYKGEWQLYNSEFLKSTLEIHFAQKSKKTCDLRERMRNEFFDGGVRHLSRFTNRMSRHFDLEMIYPFAENIKWAREIAQISDKHLFRGGASKAILRDSFINDLPQKVLDRRDKKGLLSPNNTWIANNKEIWIQYFNNRLSDVYDVDYIHDHYENWWSIENQPENYRHFKHISFAIWRRIFEV
ncbi:MAG: asparagine synthase-related protein [Saprospiraceae bacterium]